ncbi:MAG TPA: hypothetical protein VD905_08690 [Flavobacteriales bacterium]|nr:hypothetical protein [Flavobacteriales bacterium]
MKSAVFITLVTVFFHPSPELIRGYDSNGKLSYKAEVNNGMMNGVFTKYDPETGNIAAEGNFKNNLRHGTWKIYTAGKLVAHREYKNGFEFEINYIPKEGQQPKPPITKKQVLNRNPKNYIEYPALPDKDISWTKRIWRLLEPNETNAVFLVTINFLVICLNKFMPVK